MGRPFKCPYCHAERSTCKGFRRTKQLGIRQIRRCKACGRKFTPKHQKAGKTPSGSEASRARQVNVPSK